MMKFRKPRDRRHGSGFTLLDLIATVTIFGVLTFLAIPIWAKSMADARARVCTGNLGQLGRAAGQYSDDHNEQLPGNQHSPPSWVNSLSNYTSTNIYRCPDEVLGHRRSFTIALNDFLTPNPFGARRVDFSRRPAIPAPGETLMFAEADEAYRSYDHFHFADARENGYSPEAFSDQVDAVRHGGEANYLFADGHVSLMSWSSGVKPKLTAAGSKFVHPSGGNPALANK